MPLQLQEATSDLKISACNLAVGAIAEIHDLYAYDGQIVYRVSTDLLVSLSSAKHWDDCQHLLFKVIPIASGSKLTFRVTGGV